MAYPDMSGKAQDAFTYYVDRVQGITLFRKDADP